MKKQSMFPRALLLSIALITPFLVATSQAAKQSYPMMCRGGNYTAIQIVPDSGTVILLNFRKGTEPASAGLTQGMCAWMDRGIRSDEPEEVRLRFKGAKLAVTVRRQGDKDVVSYSTYGGNEINKANLLKFVTAIQRGMEFQIHVYRDDHNNFIMTTFGP